MQWFLHRRLPLFLSVRHGVANGMAGDRAENAASGIDYEGFRHKDIRYLRIDLQDQPRADLASHLPRINEFVNMARKKHAAPVLLHCSSGNGRSLAAACAYLVEHCDMTLKRALEVCAAATTLSINVRSR